MFALVAVVLIGISGSEWIEYRRLSTLFGKPCRVASITNFGCIAHRAYVWSRGFREPSSRRSFDSVRCTTMWYDPGSRTPFASTKDSPFDLAFFWSTCKLADLFGLVAMTVCRVGMACLRTTALQLSVASLILAASCFEAVDFPDEKKQVTMGRPLSLRAEDFVVAMARLSKLPFACFHAQDIYSWAHVVAASHLVPGHLVLQTCSRPNRAIAHVAPRHQGKVPDFGHQRY